MGAQLVASADDGQTVIVDMNGSVFHLESEDVIQLPGRSVSNLSFESGTA